VSETNKDRSVGRVAAKTGGFLALALLIVSQAWGEDQTLIPPNVEKANQLREDLREMVTLARDRVFPALVNIKVITARYWGGKEQKGQAVGSGTIISPDGYILTNYHVVENGKKFKVTLSDKQEITAELVGEDPFTDLAVIKLDRSESKDPNMPLSVAKFGNSDALIIGDTVMAMGSPWALSRSVTLGIVCNTERMLSASDDDAEEMHFDRDQRTGIFNRWIQHDASISPGNSGGPLVNLKGEMVGVNARGSMFGGDLGFAIPGNIAQAVAAQLIEHGEVPRSWYGLSLKPIKKSGFKEGVLINSIVVDSPADKAGLKAGDVIVSVNGKPVTVWFPEEVPPLLKQLADNPIGSTVTVTYRRGEEAHEARIVTDKWKKDRGEEAAFRSWGFVGVDITEAMARQRRLDRPEGVLVDSVRSGSPAQLAEPALAEDDVILRAGDRPIHNLEQLIDLYETLGSAEEQPEYLLLEFDRLGRNHVTLIKPKPDEDDDPPREVAKAWVGVAVQPVVKELAEQMKQPDALGFRITRVYPGTKAAESDLKVGDIIISLDGERLKPRGVQDAGMFHRHVRKLDIDKEAKLKVLRDGKEQEVSVALERTKLTPEEARRDRNRDFEIAVRETTFFDRDENRWDESVQGVLVTGVESAGWAQLGGVRPGDLIQKIDDTTITNLDEYKAAMKDITERQTQRVVFVVLRGVSTRYQYVEPDWKPGTVGEGENGSAEE